MTYDPDRHGAAVGAVRERVAVARERLNTARRVRDGAKTREEEARERLEDYNIALREIQRIGQEMQTEATYKVNHLVSLALSDVFGDEAYTFELDVTTTDKTMEADCYFVRDGMRLDPLECCGYGQVDVACFALRLAFWNMKKTRRVLILDEPFKNVSEGYQERLAVFVRKIAEELGFQFIITTHSESLAAAAHRRFVFSKKGKDSKVYAE